MTNQDLHKYYQVLEIEPGASEEEIKRAYKYLKRLYSTDSVAIISMDAEWDDDDKEDVVQGIEEAYHKLLPNVGEEEIPVEEPAVAENVFDDTHDAAFHMEEESTTVFADQTEPISPVEPIEESTEVAVEADMGSQEEALRREPPQVHEHESEHLKEPVVSIDFGDEEHHSEELTDDDGEGLGLSLADELKDAIESTDDEISDFDSSTLDFSLQPESVDDAEVVSQPEQVESVTRPIEIDNRDMDTHHVAVDAGESADEPQDVEPQDVEPTCITVDETPLPADTEEPDQPGPSDTEDESGIFGDPQVDQETVPLEITFTHQTILPSETPLEYGAYTQHDSAPVADENQDMETEIETEVASDVETEIETDIESEVETDDESDVETDIESEVET
ncbi:MAG: hypothetical protein GY765_07365, partial [bacterium]|nr:hypothetical protein [bacterium]